MVTAIAAVALIAAFTAASARADIVYDSGAAVTGLPDQVVVAHDDGSSPQAIVTSYPSSGSAQAGGVDELIAPAVSPSGKTIVFEGRWDHYYNEESSWTPFAAGFCGIWCEGVFKYQNGALTRVSNAPSHCPLAPCSVLEEQPEITAGGQIVASYQAVSTTQNCGQYSCGWFISNSFVGLDHPPRQIDQTHGFFDPQPASDIPSACSGGNLNTPTSQPQYPSPSPDGSRLVYANCTANSTPNTIVVQNMDGSNAQACASDDQPVVDPSFSLDGSHIVDAETGNDPGLWTYPSACPIANNSSIVHALTAPSGTTFQSPRYVSGGRIFFVAVPSGQKGGDVWSIPDSCGQNGTPCSFPANAQQVTHTNNNVLNVAWTSQSLVSQASPSGSGTTGQSGGSGTTVPPTPTPTPTATRCRVPKLAGKTLKVAKKALGKAHCALGKVKKKPSARKMRGKVIGQSPKAGASKARGTKVALVLGK